MARVTNSPGANLDMRSMPEGRCTGMCSVNQPPTRGFSVRRRTALSHIFQQVTGAPAAQISPLCTPLHELTTVNHN